MAATIAMGNLKEQPVVTLRITCPEVTASHFMPSFLQGFAVAYPRIAVELIATNRNLDIIRERIDFAFRVGIVTGQDMIVRRISPIRRILVAAPSYLDVSPRSESPPTCCFTAAWSMTRSRNGKCRRRHAMGAAPSRRVHVGFDGFSASIRRGG